jgi:hypothetical protein
LILKIPNKKMLRKKDQVELGGLIWKLLTSEHLVYGWKIHAFFLDVGRFMLAAEVDGDCKHHL